MEHASFFHDRTNEGFWTSRTPRDSRQLSRLFFTASRPHRDTHYKYRRTSFCSDWLMPFDSLTRCCHTDVRRHFQSLWLGYPTSDQRAQQLLWYILSFRHARRVSTPPPTRYARRSRRAQVPAGKGQLAPSIQLHIYLKLIPNVALVRCIRGRLVVQYAKKHDSPSSR
jgi:hypothetical protein